MMASCLALVGGVRWEIRRLMMDEVRKIVLVDAVRSDGRRVELIASPEGGVLTQEISLDGPMALQDQNKFSEPVQAIRSFFSYLESNP